MHFVNDNPEGKVFPELMNRYVVEAVLSADDIKIFGTDLGLEDDPDRARSRQWPLSELRRGRRRDAAGEQAQKKS